MLLYTCEPTVNGSDAPRLKLNRKEKKNENENYCK